MIKLTPTLHSDGQGAAGAALAVQTLGYVVLSLCLVGILTMGSASTVRGAELFGDSLYFVKRQLAWLAIGGAFAAVTSRLDYRQWKELACPMGLLSVALLILVLVVGRKINGCRRWLELGPITFQPSELAKFTSVLMLAYWFAQVPLRVERFRDGLLIPGAALVGVLLLVLMEPDFGATALTGAVAWMLLLVGGADKRWLLGAAALGIVLLFLYVRFDPHRWELVLAWWNPDGYPELAYHFLQSRNAFVLGAATGMGYADSIQKYYYLPETHTDFILPILGEELGLAGTLGVIALFAAFLACGTLISLRCSDMFGRLLGQGITILIALQAVFNMCVVAGFLPTKGLALPFFSYGGSNLLMTLLECGILMNIGHVTCRAAASFR